LKKNKIMDLSSEENQKKPRIFCNLIIRSLQKTIDDMNVKCPLMWNIRILKDFISKYHQKAIHTYKLESWSLFFGGKILKEEETLQSILQKVPFILFSKHFKFLEKSFREFCFYHQH